MRRNAVVAACGSFLLALASSTWAGEKIKITETPGKVDLPKDMEKSLLDSGPDSLRSKLTPGENSLGPVLPSPGQPVIIRNPKLEEFLDQKKNWMFNSPNSLDRDKTVKEIFGVKEYDFGGGDKKPKTVVERYYESGSRTATSAAPSETGRDNLSGRESENQGRPRIGEDRAKPETSGIMQALNPAILFNPNSALDGLVQVGDGLNRNAILPPNLDNPFSQKAPGSVTRDANQPRRDIEMLWDTRKTPLGKFSDPINDQMDGSRFAINPVAAKKPALSAPESVSSRPTEAMSFGSPAPTMTRSDLFSPGRSQPTGPSFVPAASPVAAPFTAPKPAVLEIPRPRF